MICAQVEVAEVPKPGVYPPPSDALTSPYPTLRHGNLTPNGRQNALAGRDPWDVAPTQDRGRLVSGEPPQRSRRTATQDPIAGARELGEDLEVPIRLGRCAVEVLRKHCPVDPGPRAGEGGAPGDDGEQAGLGVPAGLFSVDLVDDVRHRCRQGGHGPSL